MRDHFFALVDRACGELRDGEVLLANFSGEVSDFVRFNRGRVRQPMTVRQAEIELSLVVGSRRDNRTLALTGLWDDDLAQVQRALVAMRADLPSLPADPYLLFARDAAQSNRDTRGRLPSADEAIAAVVDAATNAGGLDVVGILASGPVMRGFASSFGARHWHAVDSFQFDWSIYHSTDKAVKSSWAGTSFDAAELTRRIHRATAQLELLARPPRTVSPGEYRAYLAPAAFDELLWMLNWDGMSAKAQRTRNSALQRLVDGESTFAPMINLVEDTAAGLAPGFDNAGFARPPRVALITQGRHVGSMVSARTAQEYGIEANGAGDDEGMESMALAGGTLDAADALAALDTGIAIGNLNYLNYSDRANGRITGLTRFATFWVEGGKVQAPVNVMRWDDTLYRMLGTQLEALTREPEWILNNGTYGGRSVQTSRVPGAVLSGMTFTL